MRENAKKNQKNGLEILLIITLLLFSLLFILFFTFPSLDAFAYFNSLDVNSIENTGNFNVISHSIPGFIILLVTISKICLISYDVLLTLPILIIPIILFLFIILKRIVDNIFICAILVLIYLTFISGSIYTLFCHNIGLVLLLSVIFLAFLQLQSFDKDIFKKILIFMLFIVLIISTNFTSYLQTFCIISFLIGLQLIRWIESSQSRSKSRNIQFLMIALIGTVFVLTFNQFFYNEFIPFFRLSLESPSIAGFEKLLSFLFTLPTDPLSAFYRTIPSQITYSYIFSLIFILFSLVISGIIFIYRIIKKRKFIVSEAIIFSLCFSFGLLFIIYFILGQIIIYLIFLLGVLTLGFLFQHTSKSRKIIIVSIMFLILISNTYRDVEVTRIDNVSISGQKDSNFFRFMVPSSKWYINYIVNAENTSGFDNKSTDILTAGYFTFEGLKEKKLIHNYLNIFSKNDLLFLLKSEIVINSDINNSIFIINYKLSEFSTKDWKTYNSWSNYKSNIQKNENLNIIYSSGYIDICTKK